MEKGHNFLDTPPPLDVLDFLEFGKKWKFEDPHWTRIWEKLEIAKILNFENIPQGKKHTQNCLKIPLKLTYFLVY